MDRKQLRRAMGVTGWIAVIYQVIMFACVLVTMLFEMLINMILEVSGGEYSFESMMSAAMAASSSAWGYFVAAGVGLIILLAWKKPRYWKTEIWAKGKPMKPGAFFGILSIFLCAQIIYQFFAIGLEALLNSMGFTLLEGMEALSAGVDNFSMFLYMCLLAPVSEELLFRGLIQRTLLPYGKRIAILGSAFLFGMMHGNILQTPFAFLVGLVLGYVAAEYSIGWAMVLHMNNNLVLGDMVTRLTAGLGDMAAAAIIWGVLLIALAAAVITIVRKRREIRIWMGTNPLWPGCAGCFFGSGGVITFTVLMALSMIGTLFVLITPL